MLALLLTGCSGVRVGSPDSLWLLWLVPATLVFYIYSFSERQNTCESANQYEKGFKDLT